MLSLFLCSFSSLFVSLSSVFFVRYLARKFKWLAPVNTDRWHREPRALYGGIGIYFSFIIVALFVFYTHKTSVIQTPFIILFAGGTGCFLLGLLDDIYHLRPATKLVGQIAFTSLFIITGKYFQVSSWQIFNILLTYFWFLGIINAINLLDNMDGLASGVTIICSGILLSLMILSGKKFSELPILINVIFIMSVLGFWFYNRHPATIFMGDAGSLFLGYTLATLTIPNSLSHYDINIGYSSIFSLLIPATILAIPVFDTTLVTLTRTFSGRALSQGGRDHSSHRLVGLGFSEKNSVFILYALSAIGGLAAIFMVHFQDTALYIFALYLIFLIILGIYLGKMRIYPKEVALTKKSGWTPIVRDIMFKKHMFEILLDIILVSIAYFFSWYSFSGETKEQAQIFFTTSIPSVILASMFTFYLFKIYRGVWSLISIEDIYVIARTILISVFVTSIINTLIYKIPINVPLYIIFGLLLLFIVIGSRLSFRFFDIFISTHGLSKRPIKVLLYGAGNAGKLTIDEIKRNDLYKNICPVGFIDDDTAKHGRYVSGVKIICDVVSIIDYVKQNKETIKEIWIASTQIEKDKINNLREQLPSHIVFKVLKLEITPLTK